jgi:hypothetical protein
MFGLFSAKPIQDGLHGLRFEIPGHQQYFSVGNISTAALRIEYRRQYTVEGVTDKERNVRAAELLWLRGKRGTRVYEPGQSRTDLRERNPVFAWGLTSSPDDVRLRLLLVEHLAQDLWTTLDAEMRAIHPGWFGETTATSAMVAMQLNNPSWQLQIGNMPALAVADKVGRISGALSYHRRDADSATSPSLIVQTMPAKVQARLPRLDSSRACIHRGLLPPHANSRIHKTEYTAPPSPPPPQQAATQPQPLSPSRPPLPAPSRGKSSARLR